MTHRVEEVVRAAVADELEALLEIGGEALVLIERTEMLAKPTVSLEVEKDLRVMDDSRDLRAAADHLRILRELIDVPVAHAGNALGVEVLERRLDPRPLRVDDAPANARLEHAFR